MFAVFEAQAQVRIYGPDFRLARSHRVGVFGISTTDSVWYADSLRVKAFKPIRPGEYTTATAPPASAFPGYIIINTDSTNKPQYSDGTNWINLPGTGGGGGGSGTVTSVALAAGTSGTDVNISGSPITTSGTITLNIPDASATARGLMTTGTQTIAGAKTWSNNAVFNGTATFNGTVQAGGTANGVINIASSAASVRGSIDLASNNPRLNSATGTWLFAQAGNTMGLYNSTGFFFGGGSTPTARVDILAGTTAVGPLRFNSGPLLTTPLAGVEEFLTDKRYTTITTGTARKEYALWDAAGTIGRIPFTTTNGRLLDDDALRWDNSTKVLQLGGTTSSFPGLLRDGAAIQVKLADNSANANLKVLNQAYNESTWDGNDEVPTKNAVRDETETNRYKPYSQTASTVASTSDATPTNMSVAYGLTTLPNNSSGWLKVHLVGNGQSGASTHNIHGVRYYAFHKSGGTLTLDAPDVIVATRTGGSVSTASWQVIVSSNQPVIEVTGVAAITMNWAAAVEIILVIEN